MSKERDSINSLIAAMEQCIEKYENARRIIEADYPSVGNDDQIESRYFNEYLQRHKKVNESFNRDFLNIQERLDRECKRVRRLQPNFTLLNKDNLNTKGKVPRNIILGRLRVKYKDLNIQLPHITPFPVKKPMVISSNGDRQTLFSLILRLLYTLPVGKVELNAYDPNGFGASLQQYNILFTNPEISPMKKICSSREELTEILKFAVNCAENLIQNVFTTADGCSNWSEYNRTMYLKGCQGAVLPYRVFYLCDVPDNMNEECMNLLKRLSNVCETCGMLIAMTVDRDYFARRNEKGHMDEKTQDMERFLNSALNIDEVLWGSRSDIFRRLTVSNELEDFPENTVLGKLLCCYEKALEERRNVGGSFLDIYNSEEMFSQSSVDGFEAAIGTMTDDGSEARLCFGDRVPHALIGGTTGSGKSNILHVMIMNLCKRYSPDELKLYLMDFKGGVEFAKYASPCLPHAVLIATEADKEYGLSVLEHIEKAISNRYNKFKKHGVSQYSDFRAVVSKTVMPRLLIVIDEFQELFTGKQAANVLNKMTKIVKQGRAAGVHLILATQSYKSIGNTYAGNFSEIMGQFSGRVALKCTDESESGAILGNNGNGAAAYIDVPLAILNTNSGLKSANMMFTVPYAKDNVTEVTNQLADEWQRRGGKNTAKIYSGETLPFHPREEFFVYDGSGLRIILGETADYDNKNLLFSLEDKQYQNILVCGSEERLLDGIKKSLLLSALGCKAECIVVGNGWFFDDDYPFIRIPNIDGLMEWLKENPSSDKRLIIADNLEIPHVYGKKSEFEELVLDCGADGVHIAAFYDSADLYKDKGIQSNCNKAFKYGILFGLPNKSLGIINSAHPLSSTDGFLPAGRAVVLENGITIASIKPFCDTTSNNEVNDGDDYYE